MVSANEKIQNNFLKKEHALNCIFAMGCGTDVDHGVNIKKALVSVKLLSEDKKALEKLASKSGLRQSMMLRRLLTYAIRAGVELQDEMLKGAK